ncbi:unnamed protein product [Linum trigynum]|uniref:Uncharacterized protein n=1 Tax=Linum trigynum TaxID=586398 RepID=A0AAV2FAL0_9ROSI
MIKSSREWARVAAPSAARFGFADGFPWVLSCSSYNWSGQVQLGTKAEVSESIFNFNARMSHEGWVGPNMLAFGGFGLSGLNVGDVQQSRWSAMPKWGT